MTECIEFLAHHTFYSNSHSAITIINLLLPPDLACYTSSNGGITTIVGCVSTNYPLSSVACTVDGNGVHTSIPCAYIDIITKLAYYKLRHTLLLNNVFLHIRRIYIIVSVRTFLS